jgi:hypothetical protein
LGYGWHEQFIGMYHVLCHMCSYFVWIMCIKSRTICIKTLKH